MILAFSFMKSSAFTASVIASRGGVVSRMKFAIKALLYVALMDGVGAPALAAETSTYIYDAKGRLVRVVRSGGPNSGTTTNYEHDKANNRKRVQTTGAPR